MSESIRTPIREALELLQIDDLLLGIQDPSFPSLADEDIGRGSPSSRGGSRLLALASELGFTGVQFGPQGLLSEGNPSPYDSAQFARDTLSVALAPLAEDEAWHGILSPDTLRRLVREHAASDPERITHRDAHRAVELALDESFGAFRRKRPEPLVRALAVFRSEHRDWLERDGLFEILSRVHAGRPWWEWDGPADAALDRRLMCLPPGAERLAARRRESLGALHEAVHERFAFAQFVAHEQHRTLRARARSLGLCIAGDLHIGFSPRDAWAFQDLFLEGYRLGAPPSRTNPDGQPWDYPIFDPPSYESPATGRGAAQIRARLGKLLAEVDAVRIDHPHGYVCPWVYRADAADPFGAVQRGARLTESPDLPDHPALASRARVRREDLNSDPRTPRFADDWVVSLGDQQVERYAVVVDQIVAIAAAAGRPASALVCEVLSTLPLPLARVLARHRLGRFRVTQKADPADPTDVYLVSNAAPEDWAMLGNHDTPPIWTVVEGWGRGARRSAWISSLAARLAPEGSPTRPIAEQLDAVPGLLVHALFADVLASRARHVMLFWSDLFGYREPYNTPGTVSERNWSLRLTGDFESRYQRRVAEAGALDVRAAVALALRMRGAAAGREASGLVEALLRDPRSPLAAVVVQL